MTKTRRATMEVAAIALSIASLAVSVSGESIASAAIRTNVSKLCQEFKVDKSRTNYTGQTQVNAYRTLAKVAPAALRKDLLKLAGDLQTVVNKGSASNTQEKSIEKMFNKVEAELTSKCAGR